MNMKYLSVDRDAEFNDAHVVIWAERGFGCDRVETMTAAIQKLMENEYIVVGINSDNIDFMPLLKTMRSVTITPILIATGSFTTEQEVAALENGADLCSFTGTEFSTILLRNQVPSRKISR